MSELDIGQVIGYAADNWQLSLVATAVGTYAIHRANHGDGGNNGGGNTGGNGWTFGRTKKPEAPQPIESPYAGRKEIKHLLAKKPTEGRIAFADYDGWLVETLPDHSLIVFGGARSRKTTCIIGPATRTWKGTAIVLSTKPDIFVQTKDARDEGGVAVYYPNGDVPPGVRQVGWNPLDEISEAAAKERGQTLDRAWEASMRMAHGMTHQAKAGGDIDFWMDLAGLGLAPLLMAAAISPTHDIDDVPRWVKDAQAGDNYESPLDEAIRILTINDAPSQAIQTLQDLDKKEARAKSSILTTMTTTLTAYEYSGVLATAKQPDRFRPWHLDDPTKNIRTLYLLGSTTDQNVLAPIFLGLLDEVARYYYAKADALMIRQHRNRRTPVVAPRDRLLIVLDEAANAAPLTQLDNWASTGGSHGVVLLLAYQDLSQLRQRLGGDKANTVVANCQSRIIAPGMADQGTIDAVTGLLADQAVITKSTTTVDGKRQTTESITREPILTPATLRQLTIGEAIVITGNDKPIKVTLLPQDYAQPDETPPDLSLAYTALPGTTTEDVNAQLAAALSTPNNTDGTQK